MRLEEDFFAACGSNRSRCRITKLLNQHLHELGNADRHYSIAQFETCRTMSSSPPSLQRGGEGFVSSREEVSSGWRVPLNADAPTGFGCSRLPYSLGQRPRQHEQELWITFCD